MTRLSQAIVVIAVALVSLPAFAGKLQMIDGQVYSGVVEGIKSNSLLFLWERQRDQPTPIKAGKSDMLFEAQGSSTELRAVPLDDIISMDKVPMSRFISLFNYNMFYRTMASFEASRLRVSGTGDFIHQIVAVFSLLLVLALMVPLGLVLVSTVLPGERLSFTQAFVFTIILAAVGMAFALASSELTRMFEIFGNGGAQIALTVLLIVVIGVITHLASHYGFIQGFVFSVMAGLGLVLARFAVDTVAQVLVKSV